MCRCEQEDEIRKLRIQQDKIIKCLKQNGILLEAERIGDKR